MRIPRDGRLTATRHLNPTTTGPAAPPTMQISGSRCLDKLLLRRPRSLECPRHACAHFSVLRRHTKSVPDDPIGSDARRLRRCRSAADLVPLCACAARRAANRGASRRHFKPPSAAHSGAWRPIGNAIRYWTSVGRTIIRVSN